MLTCIEGLLDAPTLDAVREQLATSDSFAPGEATAAGRARAVKHNLQGIGADATIRGVTRLLEKQLLAHPVFRAATRPRQFARLLISRYDRGMGYGTHIDAPAIDGVRTDVSFTLFLSEPGEYEGGELVIESGAGEDAVKLPAGAVVCYPSSYLHRVEAVRSGSRLVAVGWLQSEVRSSEQRKLLFALDSALARLQEHPGDPGALDELANVRANLQRMWMD
ncbi:Fe2+-dependent dioxygenase [Parahaliea aestuarii]|uniref:Fe2+-dependent dioxygenase n=1 Tax=Parahaliea aestuarii TaxID=1852021 RepID=A0A5C9A3X0_9GAMM|nr:Fe2+-dependent dioxygenase [Parahaliea aestuarii]TXS94470.1 Fe2+-dependent dioxygenase [Parahaliea aestuarii]